VKYVLVKIVANAPLNNGWQASD